MILSEQNLGLTQRYKTVRHQQAGFTLVELMVGMVIALLATLAIMQSMSLFETQKRTTTGVADAQTNANVALYSMTKDLQSAGYGLMFTGRHVDKRSTIDCTSLSGTGITDEQDLNPATIIDGGTGSDAVIVRHAETSFGGLPTKILTKPISRTIDVASNLGCKDGDVVIVNKDGDCAITRLQSPAALLGNTVVTLDGNESVPLPAQLDATLTCLGAWHTTTYSVSGGNLQLTLDANAATDTVADIVNMQAQYGISAAADSNAITSWVDATGAFGTSMTVGDRNRIKAVRIAVVSRSPKAEATDVTASCSMTTPAGLTIDLSADANCKRYRYNIYESVVPLRNMVWSKDS
ncbi:MAG: PilW family protein [Methylophilaceae bacterium]